MPRSNTILVCRLAFLLISLLPTWLVGMWVLGRLVPQHAAAERAEWEHELSTRLGCTVKIGQLSYPHYAVAVLHDVQLSDSETGAPIAVMDTVEAGRVNAGWEINVSQAEARAEQLPRLMDRLHDRLLCSGTPAQCQFTASRLTIRGGEATSPQAPAQTVTNLSGQLRSAADGPEITISCQLPEFAETTDPPIQLTLSRSRESSPPATRWRFSSPTAVPCVAAVDFAPVLAQLGPRATFQGEASFVTARDGWEGEIAGVFANVDLTTLVSEQFPHLLSGTATVRLERLTLTQGRIALAQGSVQVVGGGRIGESLLTAAGQSLGLTATLRDSKQPGEPKQRAYPYRQLSIGFFLDEQSLLLTGNADVAQPGVLVASAVGPLLEVAPDHAAPALGLVRMLTPSSQLQVPATPLTAALVRMLPLPNQEPSAAPRTSHTTARLRPASRATDKDVIRER